MAKRAQTITIEPPQKEVPILALSGEEAAEALSMSYSLFRNLVSKGLIVPVMAGTKPIFDLAELQRFLKENRKAI